MKKRVFEGVATALITPMNDDTTVNYKRLESLVDEQIKGGVDALVICGTTGEKSTLRYDEHLKKQMLLKFLLKPQKNECRLLPEQEAMIPFIR